MLSPIIAPLLTSADPATTILLTTAVPITISGILVLFLFALSLGWLRELFGPQPIRGRGWMWIAVVAVVATNALNFATIDYGKAGGAYVMAWLVSGLTIGIAEEVLTRGFVVNLMRRAGHREILVALASAGLFALLHLQNLLAGQSLLATLTQVPYTFMFGICMYLALRVTGNLIWPILLHATTDPSIFLRTEYPMPGTLTTLAGQGNVIIVLTGLVLVFFIRGRVERKPDAIA